MPALLPHIDPDGLLEFSVVYTDRALNHMSQRFQGVMRDISTMLKSVYAAKSSVLVPGSGRCRARARWILQRTRTSAWWRYRASRPGSVATYG